MTDREMLELAAKAAGINGRWERDKNCLQERWYFNVPYDNQGMLTGFEWNPLRDDGDAFRLAVRLKLDMDHNQDFACVYGNDVAIEIDAGADPCAATRLAILQAAAEVGKGME